MTSLFMQQTFILYLSHAKTTYLIGLLWILDWIMFVNSLAQPLKHSNCSINGNYHVTEIIKYILPYLYLKAQFIFKLK